MISNIEIRKYKNFDFVCWYWQQGKRWGHECRLCKDGIEIGNDKTRYYNRTWEAYKYQTVMRGAIENYKKQELAREIEGYKYNNGLKGYDMDKHEEYNKPLPRGVKAKITEEFNKQPIWEELDNFVKEGK
jgi:hypothetical protein